MRNSGNQSKSIKRPKGTKYLAGVLSLAASGVAAQMVHADTTWLGGTSQDFSLAGNWSNGVPGNGVTYINTGTGNYPVLGTGNFQSGNDIVIGDGAGKVGRLDMNGGTLATGSGNWLIMGRDGGTGTFNLNGGTFTGNGDVHLARTGTTGTATFNIAGGTANVSGSTVVNDSQNNTASGVGALSVSNGGILNAGGDLLVSFAGSNAASGTVTIGANGTVNVGAAGERWVIVNQYDPAHGYINVTGGTLNLLNGTDLRFSTGNGTGASAITISSGSIVGSAGSVLDLDNATNAGVNNTFNLDGGTFTISQIQSNVTAGTRLFNFNGGTLKAVTTNTTFMAANAASRANVRNGGAIFDTNGFNVTVDQALLHSNIGGDSATDGGLTKNSSGTLILTGNSTYTGGTTVNAGTLQIGNSTATTLGGGTYAGAISDLGTLIFNSTANQTLAGGLSGSGTLQQSGSGTLTFSNANANNVGSLQVSAGSLGLKVANTSTSILGVTNLTLATSGLTVDFNSLSNPTAPMVTSSALTLNGTVTITLAGTIGLSSTPNNTTLALMTYGSRSGAGSFTLATTAAGHTSYALNDTATALYLNVSAVTNYWRGSASSVWDINSALNWSAPDQKYLEGDNVVFDDSATGSTSVNLTATVSPTSLVFNNITKNYTLGGTGGVTGATGLVKTGAGALVITNANSYTGATSIANGASLTLGDGTNGNDGTIANTSGVTDNGLLTFNRFGTTSAGYVISGGGAVVMSGTGVQILTAANTYSGGTTISGGTLQLGDGTTGHDGTLAGTSGVADNGTLAFNPFGASTAGYTISGSGGVVMSGGGSLALTAANSYAGGTTISSGTLIDDQSATVPGPVTPFGSGTVTVNGGQVELGVNGNNFGSYSLANGFALNGGSVFAFDGFQHLSGPITVGANGGSLGSTFSTWYEARENGFQKGLFVDGLLSGSGNLSIQDSGYATGAFYNVSVVYFTNPGTSTYSGTVTTGTTAGTANYLFLVGQTVLANATINVDGNNAGGSVLGPSKLLFGPGNGVDAGTTGYTVGALSGNGNVVLEETPQSTGTNVTGGGPAVMLNVGSNNATTSYTGVLSGAGGLVKTGAGTLTLGGLNSFTGNVSISAGTLAAGTFSNGTTSNLGDLSATRTIAVNNGGVLSLTAGNVLGYGSSANTLAGVTLVVNQGGVFQTGLNDAAAGWWNKIGNVQLNGGVIHVGSGANNSNFQGLALIGNVTVGGATASTIDNFAASDNTSNGVHLGQNGGTGQIVTFNVADVTADNSIDLTVSTRLLDSSFTQVASGLSKTGAGTMLLSAANSYSGGTSVQDGTLAVSSTGTLGAGNVEVGGGATLTLATSNGISDAALLTIDTGGTMLLTGGIEVVGSLNLGGTLYTTGTFGGIGSGADNIFSDYFAPASSGNFVSTPEPTSLGLIGLGVAGLLRRRRRQVK